MPRPLLRFHNPSLRGPDADEDEDVRPYVSVNRPLPGQRSRPVSDIERGRAPPRQRNPMTLDLAAMFAEFVGTFMFLWLSFTGGMSCSKAAVA